MTVENQTIHGTADASRADGASIGEHTPDAGAVWYVDDVRMWGEDVHNSNGYERYSGIQAAVEPDVVAVKSPEYSTPVRTGVPKEATSDISATGTMGAYVSGKEKLTLSVQNQNGDISDGTLHYIIHARRVL